MESLVLRCRKCIRVLILGGNELQQDFVLCTGLSRSNASLGCCGGARSSNFGSWSSGCCDQLCGAWSLGKLGLLRLLFYSECYRILFTQVFFYLIRLRRVAAAFRTYTHLNCVFSTPPKDVWTWKKLEDKPTWDAWQVGFPYSQTGESDT